MTAGPAYHFRRMDRDSAAAIAAWRYGGVYALYDGDPAAIDSMVDPENRYFAAFDESGGLVGYCCFGQDARVRGGDYAADALDVGAGLRPDLTGQGQGPGFLAAVMAVGRREFGPSRFRATVAAFNHRSIRACQRAGFTITARFARPGEQPSEFMLLLASAEGGTSA
jgi:RimJ/RimL family protein N-acetyltransferase